MNNDPVLSSKILADVEIIADIYQIIKSAGFAAMDSIKDLFGKKRIRANETCAIPINIPGTNRKSGECINDAIKRDMKYNANDIMIVGGAALNIYDYKLSDYKIRRSLGSLEDYIKKKTSDIDIVWWPRVFVNDVVLTSRSGAFIALKNEFEIQLNNLFRDSTSQLEAKIRPYIPDAPADDKLTITLVPRGNIAAGLYNINTIFKFGSKTLKLCDVIIHDGGSSQQFDADGKEITDLRLMEKDPVYCYPYVGSGEHPESFKFTNNMVYLRVKDVNIAVPNIISFVDQQMLAFDNFIRDKNDKAFINYKRVEFIRKLLSSPDFRDNANKINFRNIFKTKTGADLSYIKSFIDNRIHTSIHKYYNTILSMCSANMTDEIIAELCESAQKAKDAKEINFDRIRQIQIGKMEELKEEIRAKYKSTQVSSFRQAYDRLYREVDTERVKLIRMSSDEYKEYVLDEPNYIARIQDKVAEIDADLQSYKNQQRASKKKPQRNRNGLLGNNPVSMKPYSAAQPVYHQSYSAPSTAYSPPHPTYHQPYSSSSTSYPAYVDAMGRPVYADPSTGRYVVWAPEYGRWVFVSPPLPQTRYSDNELFRGSAPHSSYGMYRGKGMNKTRKNTVRDNRTRKNH